MDKTFWNERFGEPGFMYGDQPNDFLKAQAHSLKPGGRILCLAEGEGRNAVYLATQGFDVTCVDFSESGLKKTQQLAETHGVSGCTECAAFSDFSSVSIQEVTREINEGSYHNGMSATDQVIAVK